MKKLKSNNELKNAKNIRDIYDNLDQIKLTGGAKVVYGMQNLIRPFSGMHLSSGLDACKRKYKKYEEEGKQLKTATERYKFAKKIIKRTLNFKHVMFSDYGFDKTPKTPVLFVANHKSNIDALLLYKVILDREEFPYVRVVAKKELDDRSRLGYLLRLLDTIFVDRNNFRSLDKVVEEEIKCFQEDSSLLLFPEGTRVQGDKLGEFHSPLLDVCYHTFVPIVPVVIFGTDGFMSQDGTKTKPVYHVGELVIEALEPIKYTEYMHWTRMHLAEVLKQRIQERYDMWKENYEYMHSDRFKKDQTANNPLKTAQQLNKSKKEAEREKRRQARNS